MRGPLHELFHIGSTGERVFNNVLVRVRKMRFAAKLLDIITISFCRRNAARRGVGLLEKSGFGKVGHHVTDGGRTKPFAAGAGKRARTDRFSAGNKCLDYGG
jgi:hypothetical protein